MYVYTYTHICIDLSTQGPEAQAALARGRAGWLLDRLMPLLARADNAAQACRVGLGLRGHASLASGTGRGNHVGGRHKGEMTSMDSMKACIPSPAIRKLNALNS